MIERLSRAVDKLNEAMAEQKGHFFEKNKWISQGFFALILQAVMTIMYLIFFGRIGWMYIFIVLANTIPIIMLLHYTDKTDDRAFAEAMAVREKRIGQFLVASVSIFFLGICIYGAMLAGEQKYRERTEEYNKEYRAREEKKNERERIRLAEQQERTRQKEIDFKTAKAEEGAAYHQRRAAEQFGIRPPKQNQRRGRSDAGEVTTAAVTDERAEVLEKPDKPRYDAEDFKILVDVIVRLLGGLELWFSWGALFLIRSGTIVENHKYRAEQREKAEPTFLPHMLPPSHPAYRPFPTRQAAQVDSFDELDDTENDSEGIVEHRARIVRPMHNRASLDIPPLRASAEIPAVTNVTPSSNVQKGIVEPIVIGSNALAMQTANQSDRIPMGQLGKGYWAKIDGREKKRGGLSLHRDIAGVTTFICKLVPAELEEMEGQSQDFVRNLLLKKAEARNYNGKQGDREKVLRAIRHT